MKIIVNRDRCEANAVCVRAAPEAFRVDSVRYENFNHGVLHVRSPRHGKGLERLAERVHAFLDVFLLDIAHVRHAHDLALELLPRELRQCEGGDYSWPCGARVDFRNIDIDAQDRV